MKPYSVACERNRDAILPILRDVLAASRHVLEIGSGTGQHAVYFAQNLPRLTWQTSDLPQNHDGILHWIKDSGLANVLPPIALDANDERWPAPGVDAVFTANTFHIMSWCSVQNLFVKVGRLLPEHAPFCIYGPFNYRGEFTSPSNASFDAMLRAHDPASGIRDFEQVCELAKKNDMDLASDHAMPANNRLLVFRRGKAAANLAENA